MRFLGAEVASAHDLPHPFGFADLPEGAVVVVHGPNAAGKSTLLATLRACLWPELEPPTDKRKKAPLAARGVRARIVLELAGRPWEVRIEDGRRRVLDGFPADRLPPASLAPCYHLSLRDLFGWESDAPLADRLRRAWAGGLDLDRIRKERFDHKWPRDDARRAREARAAVVAAKDRLAKLAHDLEELEDGSLQRALEEARRRERLHDALTRRAQEVRSAARKAAALGGEARRLRSEADAAAAAVGAPPEWNDVWQEWLGSARARREGLDEHDKAVAAARARVAEAVAALRGEAPDDAELPAPEVLAALDRELEAFAEARARAQAAAAEREALEASVPAARADADGEGGPAEADRDGVARLLELAVREHVRAEQDAGPPSGAARRRIAVGAVLLVAGAALLLPALGVGGPTSVAGLVVATLAAVWLVLRGGRAGDAEAEAKSCTNTAIRLRRALGVGAEGGEDELAEAAHALWRRAADATLAERQQHVVSDRLRKLRQAEEAAERELARARDRWRSWAEEHGFVAGDAPLAVAEWLRRLDALRQARSGLREAEARRAAAADAAADLWGKLREALGGAEDASPEMVEAALARRKVEHEAWRQRSRRAEEAEARAAQAEAKWADLEASARDLPEEFGDFAEFSSLEALAEALEARAETLAEAGKRYAELQERKARLERDRKEAEGGRALEAAEAEAARLEGEVTEEARRVLRAEAGALLLERVATDYERDNRPRVIALADEFTRRFTRDRYGLTFETRDGGVPVALDLARGGVVVPLEALSDGTRAQVLFALRLAFVAAQEEEVGVEPAPLFLDEVLSTADPERFRAVAEAVATEARSGRQVFYATANPSDLAVWRDTAATVGAELAEVEIPHPTRAREPRAGGEGAGAS